jgi:hypothetical protein
MEVPVLKAVLPRNGTERVNVDGAFRIVIEWTTIVRSSSTT